MSSTLEFEPSRLELPTDPELTTELVTGLQRLSGLDDAWTQLGSRKGGPIEQFEWSATCADFLPAGSELECLVVRRGDQLAAVLPLAVKRVRGVRRAVMLGVDQNHEPMDVLYDDPQALSHLIEGLLQRRQPILLGRLPADGQAAERIGRALKRRAIVLTRPQPSFPFIPLDAGWKQPEQQLSSRRRSDYRRALRRAEKLGAVQTDILQPEPSALDALLDQALAVEAKSWKGRQGTAMACDPVESAFCRQYAHAACRRGILRLCLLRIDNQPVAMQIAMVQGGGFWLLKIGYDADYSQCSPGILLLRESIAYAAEHDLNTFEFLGQTEPWIEVWTSHQRACLAIRSYPYNLVGGLALLADTSVTTARRLRDKTQQWASGLRSLAKRAAMPIVKRAAQRYVAGDTLQDAFQVVQRLAVHGKLASIGFWDRDDDQPQAVAEQYLAALDCLKQDRSTYLSLKLPSLQFSYDLMKQIAERARDVRVRLHFDSLAIESAGPTREIIDRLLDEMPSLDLGVTLPGRWQRSLDDADWACRRGLYVRVVKGEWADPEDPHRDLRGGYTETIDRLAGHARRVGVATHDPLLGEESIRCLQSAGTACDLELLYGLPMRGSLKMAERSGVDVRIYVPYGEAYMPYALSQLRRKPRILWWLMRDLFLRWS